MSRLRPLVGGRRRRPSLQAVGITTALILSVVAIILPQVQRSGTPEPIRETFTVGERVYELRVAPRPLTSDLSDEILAEAVDALELYLYHSEVMAEDEGRTLVGSWLMGDVLTLGFETLDGFQYRVSVTRLEGPPLLRQDEEGMSLLGRALRGLVPEGYEHLLSWII